MVGDPSGGHSLAVDLLKRTQRPVVVVLTGLVEPRLAKDLLARGADGVFFKPVDYKLFAAKVKTLCERRWTAAGRSNAAVAGIGLQSSSTPQPASSAPAPAAAPLTESDEMTVPPKWYVTQ